MKTISDKIAKVKEWIQTADSVLIGAGSGLSTAAGICYEGNRFKKNFEDFIERYHFTDMYTSSFYDFETEQEKWAYWAKHIFTNDIRNGSNETISKYFSLDKK